jgi:membrane fusion protein (multidrug efflux system)
MTDTSNQNQARAPKQQPAQEKKSKGPLARIIAITVVATLLIGGGAYMFLTRNDISTDDAAIDGNTVTLAPKVAGYVKTLNIDDNQVVKAGDVILEIDPSDYITKRDHARAALHAALAAADAAQSNTETTSISAPSNLEAAAAQVQSAQANWEKAQIDLHRMQRLSNEARSQEQLDAAVANEKAMHSNLIDAQAKYRSAQTAPKAIAQAEANQEQLEAQAKQAAADYAQAELDLANTKVIAPIDGRITRRSVEKGNYVQPGQSLGSLVGTDLWVVANYKETQLTKMRPGQSVTIAVDAYPNLKLQGTVDSVQAGTGSFFSAFPAENATGNFVKIVQRVPVKITLDKPLDPALAIGPGMSVEPTVDVASSGDHQDDDKDNDDGKDQTQDKSSDQGGKSGQKD